MRYMYYGKRWMYNIIKSLISNIFTLNLSNDLLFQFFLLKMV